MSTSRYCGSAAYHRLVARIVPDGPKVWVLLDVLAVGEAGIDRPLEDLEGRLAIPEQCAVAGGRVEHHGIVRGVRQGPLHLSPSCLPASRHRELHAVAVPGPRVV